MAKKGSAAKARKPTATTPPAPPARAGKPSASLDTRVIYCGDCLEQLKKLPDGCIDLIYIDPAPVSAVDPPFNTCL